MLSFAKRPQREPVRMLFAGNLFIIKTGWYVVGLCWLVIPASYRRWPPGAFQWPEELHLTPWFLQYLQPLKTCSTKIHRLHPNLWRVTAYCPTLWSLWMVQWVPWCYRKVLIYPTVTSRWLLQSGSCAVKLESAGFKRHFSRFPMSLLNAGDSTNALSQQCWQKDRSHLLLPLCQHRCSGSVGGVQPHKRLWQHKQRLHGVAVDGAWPYTGDTNLTCLRGCGVKHWSWAATSG